MIHYGWLIGLEDGNPFRNIKNLSLILTLTFFIPLFVFSLHVMCFKCKNLRNSNDYTILNQSADKFESPRNYKWYKLYSAFKISFFIRVMIQILMTVVLISHPLCKLIIIIYFYGKTKVLLYSLWRKQLNARRICSHIHIPNDIHLFSFHCLDTILKLWQITSYKTLQCWVLQWYHIER